MSIGADNQELSNAEGLIDKIIQIDSAGKWKADFDLKLDLLERTIELIRIKNKNLKNKFHLEDFIQSNMFAGNNGLHFSLPNKGNILTSGTGIRPIQLQPKLLLFLLMYHKEEYRVIDTIRLFIDKIWDCFGPLDFKRTETGVTRCFTNTRFAATSLRDYSLLKFGRKEAYKTWVLSLPGFLVASIVLEKHQNKWHIEKYKPIERFPLHQDILEAYNNMEHFDNFVGQLAKICQPDTNVFKTFDDVLKKAYKLLSVYWKIINDPKMSHKQMKEKTSDLIQDLDSTPYMEQFYFEFSKCLNINRLLSENE